MKLYPIMINLENKPVIVIGGGVVALRKIGDLLDANAIVKVVSPEIHEEIDKLAEKNEESLILFNREFIADDLDGSLLVFIATDDNRVNKNAYEESVKRNIMVNSACDAEYCSFFVPSFTRNGDFLLSVSTSGKSPAMAARIRRNLENLIPENINSHLALINTIRNLLKTNNEFSMLTSDDRGNLIKKIVNDDNFMNELISIYIKDNNEDFKEDSLIKYLKKFV